MDYHGNKYGQDEYTLLKKRCNQNGIYIEFLPSYKLRPFIKRYYFIEGFDAFSDIKFYSVSKENIELHIHYGQGYIEVYDSDCKLYKKYKSYVVPIQAINRQWITKIKECMAMVSIEFTLLGARCLLNINNLDIFDKIYNVDEILGDSSLSLIEGVENIAVYEKKIVHVEQFFSSLLKKIYKQEKIYRVLLGMHNQFSGCNLSTICKKSNLSLRTLERYFSCHVGLCPKEFMQIVRFNRACELLVNYPQIGFLEIIYRCHYYDQSHFIKEFKKLAGISPLQYVERMKGLLYLGRTYIL